MTIHKEGIPSIIIGLIILGGIILLIHLFIPGYYWYHFILDLSAIITWIFLIRFFRKPKRISQYSDDDIIIAPADGTVVAVEQALEKEYFNKEMIQVSIFMSVFNVHVNWVPTNGEVLYKKHHKGKHLFAWSPKASFQNERTCIVVKSHHRSIYMMRQIAGGLARRIVCYLNEGMKVAQGEEAGIIKFGSRVDLILPLSARVFVNPGDKVRGGESILGRLS